jgi:hypothetical protein
MDVMTPFEAGLESFAYTEFPRDLFLNGKVVGARPYASEIEDILASDRGIGAAAVFCVDELPTVCLVDGGTLGTTRDRRIAEIRQRLWNQNLASVVLIIDPDSVAAYSVSDRDAAPEVVARSQASGRSHWSAYEVQSGFIRDRLSSWFSPDERVDQRLLANLRSVVKELIKAGLNANQSEALMAQVIFLCYLEQRAIVADAYRNAHGLELLEALVSRSDGAGVDRLLYQLSQDFNGDFLGSTAGGAPSWASLPSRSFGVIGRFLQAVDIDTGQGSLWRYDFSHIPVELISGLYETLLKDRQGLLGAYYTPRHLANLVVEQAFEGIPDPSLCTVYDGASGSGILLTTAFRKMLRCAEVREGHRLSLTNRIALMRQNVFGNDIDETACWITAFSLYLSLLEGLDPSDISLLQSDHDLKLPPLIGDGLNIHKGSASGDFFSSDNSFAGSRRFDVFLCNPPWRESEDEEDPSWEKWVTSHSPPYPLGRRQIATGFAYRATESVRDNGVITLIMPLNLIVGASEQSSEFRQRWLQEVVIQRIINFADVRRLLFSAAKHPCAVVRVTPRPRRSEDIIPSDETVEYWTPKTDVSLALGRLALHAVDKKTLQAREVYDKPYLLITNYWGDKRDVDLIAKLRRRGNVGDTMNSRSPKWISGKGFHAPNQSNPDRGLGLLSELDFLDADSLPAANPACSAPSLKVKDRFAVVASPGGSQGRLYWGPRVLFPDGLLEDYTMRAAYSGAPFAFQSSIAAIGAGSTDGGLTIGGQEDADLLKFLSCYMRSPLSAYLSIMTGYSVIGERPRIAVEDFKWFPFHPPQSHPDGVRAQQIITQIAETVDRMATLPPEQRDKAYSGEAADINELIYQYFGLTDSDRILVKDVAGFVAKSLQPPDFDCIATPLLHRPAREEIDEYLKTLSTELAHWRRSQNGGGLSVDVALESATGFFGAVRVSTGDTDENRSKAVVSQRAFQNMLDEIYSGLAKELTDSRDKSEVFKIPNIMAFVADVFYFVKPFRRRFWLSRAALADADHIIKTVQAVRWREAYK